MFRLVSALSIFALSATGCGGSTDQHDMELDDDTPIDLDGDGFDSSEDCNDADGQVFPGAAEVAADGVDQDCDEQESCYLDSDGDGYGGSLTQLSSDLSCGEVDVSVSALNTDCDDSDAEVYPGAQEQPADHLDQDCDGQELCYTDSDGDGYGTEVTVLTTDLSCGEVDATVSPWSTDCDDAHDVVYPDASEVCGDGLDNDCLDGDPCGLEGVITMAEADATISGDGTGQWTGIYVAADGDLNGDGFDDVVVVSSAQRVSSMASIFYGPLAGSYSAHNDFDVAVTNDIENDWINTAEIQSDLNGDGLADLVVGSPASFKGASWGGAAFVFADFPSTELTLNDADLTLVGEYCCQMVGMGVDVGGDITGDGIDDLLVGSPGYSHLVGEDSVDAGAVLGVPWSTDAVVYTDDLALRLIGNDAGSSLGNVRSTEIIGDVNGDGHADLMVAAPLDSQVGTVYLFDGPVDPTIALEDARATFSSPDANGGGLGSGVAGLGDVNGDGYDDVIIGSAGLNDTGLGVTYPMTGAAFLFYGPVSGDLDIWAADTVLLGEGAGDCAGLTLSEAGDIDGDGYDDVLVSAEYNDDAMHDAGAVYLFYGPVDTGTISLASADAVFYGITTTSRAGLGLSGGGDVNGDGYDDLIIGAPGANGFTGAAYVFYGEARL